MPHETTSSSRSNTGFRFPYDKYEDEIALYENFRYLQEYLRLLGQGDKYDATIIFAASNSHNRSSAHVKCSGVNDQNDIQDAIDNFSAGARLKLVFLEGNYALASVVDFGDSRSKTLVTGNAVFDCDGAAFASGVNVTYQGLQFTGGASGIDLIHIANASNNGGSGVVLDCVFDTVTARSIIRIGHAAGGREDFFYAAGNTFRDVTIAGGGGFSPNGVFWGDDGSAGDRYGLITGNFFDNVTGRITESNGGAVFLVTGNTFRDSTGGSPGIASNDGVYFHNEINGTYTAGDHAGVDHGALSGLTDDDHTQYLKEEASGGLASEVPDHTHASGAEAGQFDAANLGSGASTDGQVLTSDGLGESAWEDATATDTNAIHVDESGEISLVPGKPGLQPGDHFIIEDSASGDSKKSTEFRHIESSLDHGSIAGLTDDDHPQYFTRSGVADADSAWSTWSPTWTNLTVGNGTEIARYIQVGKTIHIYYALDFGTTTTVDGTSPSLSIPVTAVSGVYSTAGEENLVGTCLFVESGVASHSGTVRLTDLNNMRPRHQQVSGSNVVAGSVTASAPFTWSTDDRIIIHGRYEAA